MSCHLYIKLLLILIIILRFHNYGQQFDQEGFVIKPWRQLEHYNMNFLDFQVLFLLIKSLIFRSSRELYTLTYRKQRSQSWIIKN
jgi:hypothetical protein